MKPYNYIHIKTNCPECKNHKVLHDPEHMETYCTHCGLILQDTRLTLITSVIGEEKKKEMALRQLWHRRIQIKQKE